MNNKYQEAIVAGFLIGLGVIINTISSNPVVGAVLFSFGLLTIIKLGLPLYTGRIGFINKDNYKEIFCFLFLNFFGICACLTFYFLRNYEFLTTFIEKANIKFNNLDIWQFFFSGILCGTLIHFAVKAKETIITIFAVTIFILIGSDHCIADFPYFVAAASWINLAKFLAVVIGNSCGAIILENLLKKEGN